MQRVVACVERAVAVRVAQLVAMVLGTPAEVADDLARPRVEQQFVRVEAVAMARLMRPMDAQSVDQARPYAVQESVEHAVARAVQPQACELARAGGVEHAQIDGLCVVGEDS